MRLAIFQSDCHSKSLQTRWFKRPEFSLLQFWRPHKSKRKVAYWHDPKPSESSWDKPLSQYDLMAPNFSTLWFVVIPQFLPLSLGNFPVCALPSFHLLGHPTLDVGPLWLSDLALRFWPYLSYPHLCLGLTQHSDTLTLVARIFWWPQFSSPTDAFSSCDSLEMFGWDWSYFSPYIFSRTYWWESLRLEFLWWSNFQLYFYHSTLFYIALIFKRLFS